MSCIRFLAGVELARKIRGFTSRAARDYGASKHTAQRWFYDETE
jgi:hypothetical protein